jgi:AcrR family transcriptional regulator
MARPRSDIAPRILHAARARFLAEGVDGASLRTIAKDAKTNVGMIVYYFPSKDDLFLAVVEEVYAGLLHDLEHALHSVAGTRERLGAAFARLGAASDDELEVIRLVVREALLVPASPRFSRLLSRFRRGHLGMLLATLAEGVSAGEIDENIPLPLLMLATFAMGGFPQIVRRVAGHELPFAALPPAPELARSSVELLFRAIGSATVKPASSARSVKQTRKAPRKRRL